MPLLEVFHTSVFAGLAILVCLASILWSVLLTMRSRNSRERFLIGFIGPVAIDESLRVLTEAGVLRSSSTSPLAHAASFVAALLFLLALLVVRLASSEHRVTKVRLRLAEATGPMTAATLESAVTPMPKILGAAGDSHD